VLHGVPVGLRSHNDANNWIFIGFAHIYLR
jgi:hypothetical protein